MLSTAQIEISRRKVTDSPKPTADAAPLADAIQRADVEAVQQLLAACPNINGVRLLAKLTPLHLACRCYALAQHGPKSRLDRAEQIVNFLLDAGADPEARDAMSQLPASWGNPPRLRERMREIAEAGRIPVTGFGTFEHLGSSCNGKTHREGYDNTASVLHVMPHLAFVPRSF
ncbi:MAG: hypothetical protein BGP10_13210 [Rhodanobacter sp. 68-29]|nr:hypothetical protein [Rhodanobacter sp.]ODU92199.1 MAG: hypothetical protein ABT18_13045 [Rhodanobacter sp. SCN 66-43]OJY58283.1 MAG: hypothetical protein BGP10_13210 [Rhodanobacter sp. 68-29]